MVDSVPVTEGAVGFDDTVEPDDTVGAVGAVGGDVMTCSHFARVSATHDDVGALYNIPLGHAGIKCFSPFWQM